MANPLQKLIFGLDISDSSIEALQLTLQRKIKAFGRVTIEEGIVKDGFILNKEKLTAKIQEVISKAKINAGRVILSLPESKIFIHLFQLPTSLKGEKLKAAIGSEVEKTVPLEISKIYWDYQVVSPQLKNGQQLILFVGTLKEIVDGYIEIFDKIEVEPVAFEIESIALNRALLRDLKSERGIMIIDIGARTTNISIFDKGNILRESATVSVAGNKFTKALSRKLKVSLDKAEKLKRSCGLDRKKEKGKVAIILEKELQPVIKQIKKSIEYYGQEIGDVFLVGGSAQLPGIAKFLSSSTDLKVNVGTSPLASKLGRRSILFNTVIGLALRGLKKESEKTGINLLPKPARPKPSLVSKKTRKKKFFPYLGIGLGISSLIFLAWTVYTFILKPLSEEPLSRKALPVEEIIPVDEEILEEELVPEEATTTEEEATTTEEVIIIIQETETGWLNVREGPSTTFPILMKIYPGESYPLLEEFDYWYKIGVEEQEGWIASRYATTIE